LVVEAVGLSSTVREQFKIETSTKRVVICDREID
jgi:hypothetical protein